MASERTDWQDRAAAYAGAYGWLVGSVEAVVEMLESGRIRTHEAADLLRRGLERAEREKIQALGPVQAGGAEVTGWQDRAAAYAGAVESEEVGGLDCDGCEGCRKDGCSCDQVLLRRNRR